MQQLKNKIKQILKYFGCFGKRSKWPRVTKSKEQYFINNIRIKTAIDTINDIKTAIVNKEKGAYMRFGDGDIYLMLGLDELLNKANKKLAKEMKEAINGKIGTIHVGLPIHSNLFGFEVGMKDNMHLVSDIDAIKYVGATYKNIDLKCIYTPVALHYLAAFNQTVCVDFLRFLKSVTPIFVGNCNVKHALVKKLFGDVHIKTPSSNSYVEIDRIEKELELLLKENRSKFQVVVVAMGCPGRILQKRILKKGYNVYLFDFGSLLDAFNDENTRLWIDLAGGSANLKNVLKNLD
jgi:hypothetical protein